MALSKKLVKEFQELHLKKFGVEISSESAELELLQLAELVRLTAPEEMRKR